MNLFKNKQSGFTIIETIATIAILAVLMTMGTDFIRTGFQAIRFGSEQADATDNGRKAMSSIAVDVREAAQSERGDYPLSIIQPQNFQWYGDINNDGKTELIRYYLENSNFMRIVTLPDSSNQYTIAGGTTTIAQYINNQSNAIFTYYDSNNSTTANINEVRLIRIRIFVNVTPLIMPNDFIIETDIQLRNLKDNL